MFRPATLTKQAMWAGIVWFITVSDSTVIPRTAAWDVASGTVLKGPGSGCKAGRIELGLTCRCCAVVPDSQPTNCRHSVGYKHGVW